MSTKRSQKVAAQSVLLKKAAAVARPVAPNKPVPVKTKLKVIAALKRLHPMD
ncbi:MAG: hypothetical protein QM723_32490 [Myxococcaceae bacterium]